MATKAKAAKGTLLKRGDGAGSESFTTIGEVASFSGPKRTAPAIDATSFDSAAEEFVAGLPSSGEVSFEMNFVGDNAQQIGLETDRVAGTLRNFQLQLNNAVTSTKSLISFAAIITALDLAGQGSSAKYTSSCTLKISGALTIAAPS